MGAYLAALAIAAYGVGMIFAAFREPTFLPHFFRVPGVIGLLGARAVQVFRVLMGVVSIACGLLITARTLSGVAYLPR